VGRRLGRFSRKYAPILPSSILRTSRSSIKEKDGVEGLVLGGGGNVFINGKMGQKGLDLFFSHLTRMFFLMEEQITLNPVQICLFGAVS